MSNLSQLEKDTMMDEEPDVMQRRAAIKQVRISVMSYLHLSSVTLGLTYPKTEKIFSQIDHLRNRRFVFFLERTKNTYGLSETQ